ncbi:hypothetical protein SSX86_012359 [Deinandra increscens subsp. villosa]|uniref:GATA transcription factor n=1 Tax=Deinandra increscens subsp. villosa TaxID=3103831 RepID=A0AAP0GYQ6_9ASTR
MDIYGELFDFSGDCDDHHLFSSSTTTTTTHNITSSTASATHFHYATDFSLPSDDVAELEWLSNFVDNSVSNFPANNIAGTINFRPETTPFHSRSRTKRPTPPSNNTTWISQPSITNNNTSSSSETTSSEAAGVFRRCTHCASEKTPQWRTGPLGPKTLCNACGVRYKSGRLVPEYRPAASPTFVLTQHSNSHRKVMELRRQKEVTSLGHRHQQQVLSSEQHQIYGGGYHRQPPQSQLHHGGKYEIC